MATILEKWRTEWLPKRLDGHDPREMAHRMASEHRAGMQIRIVLKRCLIAPARKSA
jgi:hypothetical protein